MNIKKWFIGNDYTHIIPDNAGCYAIYTLNYTTKTQTLIYIGTAKSLSKRLNKHEIIKVLRAISDDLIVIKCKIIEDMQKRLSTEKYLIKRLQPKANTAGIYND